MKRDQLKIREWMAANGWGVMRISRTAVVKYPTVCSTLAGRRNDRKTLRVLVEAGCPVEFLGLPEDLRRAA